MCLSSCPALPLAKQATTELLKEHGSSVVVECSLLNIPSSFEVCTCNR